MSLAIRLAVNGDVISTVVAVRQPRPNSENPDSVNTYDLTLYSGSRDVTPWHLGAIQHRYGDGALELAAKALITASGALSEASSSG